MIDNDLTVSVCIPTYGKKPNLDKLLKSLERQSDTNFEILIIHNYQEKIKHDFPKKNSLPINYTFTEEIGVSNARNLGISLSNTDLIFFIDDDEIPDTKWVEFLKKPFQRDNSLVGLGGVVKSTQNKNVLKKDSYISSLLSEKYVETYRSSEDSIASKKNIEIFGGNFGLRLNAIKKYNFKFKPYLGRIKDILLSGEESQFFKEIRNMGLKIAITPLAIVFHDYDEIRLSKNWLFKRIFWQAVTERILDSEDDAKTYTLEKRLDNIDFNKLFKNIKNKEFNNLADEDLIALLRIFKYLDIYLSD